MDDKLAVVILAAGKSTRFKSATTKLLHELAGKPVIEWVLDAVAGLLPAQTVVVYGEHSAALLAHYRPGTTRYDLTFALQDPPLGTGHALLQAEALLAPGVRRLLVLPGDAPLLREEDLLRLVQACDETGAEHAVLTANAEDPAGYGRVVRSKADHRIVDRIVEHVEATLAELELREINSGVYLFSRAVFGQVQQAAAAGPSRAKGEYFLPEVVRLGSTAAVLVDSYHAIMGINDRVQFAEAEAVVQRRLREYWMRQGVTFRLGETTYLHHDVQLAQDVEVGPHCVLTAGTRVGEGTQLIQGCLLETCVVGRHCTLRHTRGLMAVLEDNVSCGPYVNMRPGTVLHEGVKVGNFVETKNADVGAGSKLPHLQYIGDVTLGEGCNIGAGTIFCNYDGVTKHHTYLGQGVFIGSNSSLQGGITLGDEAYVAMGSAITKDVPAGALAVGRARQENKVGYVAKLKQRLQQRKAQANGIQDGGTGGAEPEAQGSKEAGG